MPVEIRELVIRAVVADRPTESSETGTVSAPSEFESRETLVQECVREVMRILRRAKER